MVTYDEYFIDIISQILDSHGRLSGLEDKPGDLDTINKEVLRITALFRIVINRVGDAKNPRPVHQELAAVAGSYLDAYSFEHEIGMVSTLYSDDPNRVRNLRYKILESFEETKVSNKLKCISEELA